MITVFISSTIENLRPERQAVKKAIADMGMQAVMAEEGKTMPAQSQPSKAACENAVTGSDIYILLLGPTFGYEFETGLSVTRFEYQTARRLEKPILVFNLEGEKEEKQQQFANRVGDFHSGYFWRSIPKTERLLRLEAEVKDAILNNYEMRLKTLNLPEGIRFNDIPWEFFIPRHRVMERIREKLTDPAARLITICGSGGIGKTALVNETARLQAAAKHYPDGIFIFPCEAIQSPEILFSEFIRKFQFDEKTVKTPRILADRLRLRKLLLILDNFETLLTADPNGATEFLETLLRYTREPKFLVTSREVCQVNGEQKLSLPKMAQPEARALFLKIAANYQCEISETGRPALETLVTEMDGLPLAIVLCAPQLQWTNPPALLAAWKKERSSMLAKEDHRATRLNSVDFSLELSFKRLKDKAARRLFSVLSLFKGGAAENALESIFGQPPGKALAELRRRHLAYLQDNRIKLLEPVRHFAAKKWENEEQQAEYRRQFVHFFTERAAQWYDDWFHNRGGEILPRFAQETENMFSAAGFLNELPEDAGLPQLTALAVNCAQLFAWNGLSRQGIELLAMGAAAAKKTGDRPGEANCYRNLGELYFLMSENEKAESEFERALPLYREVGSKLGEANCQCDLGLCEIRAGQIESGVKSLEEAIRYFESIPHYFNAAITLVDLSDAVPGAAFAQHKTWLEKAAQYYRRAGREQDAKTCQQKLAALKPAKK